MFTELFPIITTADLERALRFYRDLLGATIGYTFAGPDGTPGYVGLDLGSTHVGVGRDPELTSDGGRQRISLWVYADDCDQAIVGLRDAGVTILEEPVDQPWGERVARVSDPDGNVVIIGSRSSLSGE
jgi:lactoylglutathione lyase